MRWLVYEERGQALTEFALLVPVLLLLVCGIFDFGRMMFAYMHLHSGAQETVRLGGLGKTDAELQAFARDYVDLGDDAALRVTISPLQANRKSGQYITVTLQYPLPYITPVVSKVLPAQTVTAASTIRIE